MTAIQDLEQKSATAKIDGGDGRAFDVKSPVTGSAIHSFPLMNADAVDAAVRRARDGFLAWRESTIGERARVLKKAAAILADNAEKYATIVSAETGKTVVDAMITDVYPSADLMHHYAKNLKRYLKPKKVDVGPLLPGRRAYHVLEPLGVIGIISPWNYPLSLSCGPVATAVATGNSAILKPASQTTASGKIVHEIFLQAGLPADALQFLSGSGSETGQALIDHPGLDMIFFTGSTEVGRMVNVKAAERLIPAVMELGGKDFVVVTKNADLDRAAHGVVWGSFVNTGQTCIGLEVCLVDRTIHDRFVEKVVELTKGIQLGQQPGNLGSMTMADTLAKVEDQVRDAVEKGARVLTGGKREQGMYYPPTVIAGVTPDMKVMKDETFGPLLPIVAYDSLEEAVRLVNSTGYGLSGSVFTRDMQEGRTLAGRFISGSVNINDALITYVVPELPFGGAKESGVGRYHGEAGIRAFSRIKSITEYQGDLIKEPFWYPLGSDTQDMIEQALKALFSGNPLRRMSNIFKVLKLRRKLYRNPRLDGGASGNGEKL